MPGGLDMTTSKDVLEALASGAGPEAMLVTLGYSGWAAGQLEDELGRNGWLTVDADPAVIFDTPVEQRYERALSLLGIDPRMLSPGGGARMSAPGRPCAASADASWPSTSAPARVGVAMGNTPAARSAQPLTHASAAEGDAALRRHRRAGRTNGSPTRWWSACPSTPTARAHENTRRARRFARQLHGRFRLPVHEVDERYTTTEALAGGRAPMSTPRRRR